MGGTPQAIVPDFVEPLGQHMLQQAADELGGRQGHGLPAMISGVLVAEADLAVLDREQTAIGQRNPVDIPAQVVQDLLRALEGGFAVDDPSFGPDHLGHKQVRPFLTHQVHKQPAKELREGVDGNQVRCAARPPLAPVGGDSAGGYEAVHVRMVGQSARPGVQHTQDPAETPNVMRIRGELEERLRRGAEQDVIEIFLVAAYKRTQFSGQGEDDVKVGDRQEFLPPRFQPGVGLLVVACGATAVAAGVVDIVLLTTGVALQHVAP